MHREAVELTALTDGEIADVDHFLNLTKALLVALSHFVRDEGAEAVFLGTQGVAVLADDLPTLGSGPFAPFDKRFRGSSHHTLVVVVGGGGKGSDALAVHRGVAVDGRARTESFRANHDAVVLVLDAEVGKDVLDVHGLQRYAVSDRDRPSTH